MVSDTTGGALLLYDVTGKPRATGSVPVPDRPYGLAYDPTRQLLFVTATGANRLLAFRVRGGTLTPAGSWPTVRDAYAVAVDAASRTVVVVGEYGAQLQLLPEMS